MPVTPPQLRRPRALWRSGFPLGYQKLAPSPVFPVNGLLDQFNRADEDPLANGTWGAGPIDTNGTTCKIVSNQVRNTGTALNGRSWWSTQFASGDMEAYCDLVVPIATVGQGVWVRVQNPNDGALATGYFLAARANNNDLRLFRLTAGHTYTQIGSSMPMVVQANDGIGLSIVGSYLIAWYRKGLTGGWTPQGSFTDATITGAGYIGIEHDNDAGGTARVDNFGGGAVPVVTSVTDTTTIAGALAAGFAPTIQVPVPQGGAVGGGTAPVPSVPVPQGGATAGGFAPASSTSVTLSGATAGGFGPTARVTLTIAGAVAGGFAPSETFGDTPTPGGAIAGGFAPTARIPTAISGAVAAGLAATVRVTTPVGGAVAQGFAPFSAQTVVIGGATAGGFGPTARVTMTIGGATAGGNAPNDGSAPSGPGPYDANYFLLIHP